MNDIIIGLAGGRPVGLEPFAGPPGHFVFQPITPMGYIIAVMKPGYRKDKEALLARLSRIEGQIRGVSRMVRNDEYCIDVLTQINAVKAAVDQVGLLLLEDHVKTCVVDAAKRDQGEKLDELVKAVGRFAKA